MVKLLEKSLLKMDLMKEPLTILKLTQKMWDLFMELFLLKHKMILGNPNLFQYRELDKKPLISTLKEMN
jgi:hypothetical protein